MSLDKQAARATSVSTPAPKTSVSAILPWDPLPGERLRQNSILAIIAVLCLLLILVIETTTISRPDTATEVVPERLARLVVERQQEPPPPPPPPSEPEPQPETPRPEAEQPTPAPRPEPAQRRPAPSPERVEQARERARQEVQVFEDSLAGLRDMAPVVGGAGGAQGLRRGGNEATTVQRDLLTSRAGTRSGGISTGSVSSGGSSGGSLGGAQVAQVESSIAGNAEAAQTVRQGNDGKSRRTEEQIRRTFDRYAGRINAVYQRALRSNPALQGQLVVSMVIEPDGSVSGATITSTELNDPELERRVITVIRSMDFGSLSVDTWRGDYPINFFPS